MSRVLREKKVSFYSLMWRFFIVIREQNKLYFNHLWLVARGGHVHRITFAEIPFHRHLKSFFFHVRLITHPIFCVKVVIRSDSCVYLFLVTDRNMIQWKQRLSRKKPGNRGIFLSCGLIFGFQVLFKTNELDYGSLGGCKKPRDQYKSLCMSRIIYKKRKFPTWGDGLGN